MVFPKMNFEGNSKAEDEIWNRMNKILPDNYLSFHNYLLDSQEVDWILFVPDYGVLIIEIKGFLPKSISYAIDNTNILMSNGGLERSPYLQARRYWKKMLDMIAIEDGDISNVYIAKAICYPYLSEEDVIDKQLNKLCDRKFILTREDISNFDILAERISKIFKATYEVAIPDGLENGFNEDIKNKLAEFLFPGYNTYIEKENNADGDDIQSKYSILVSSNCKNEEKIDYLFDEWKKGAKIMFFSSHKPDVDELNERAKKYISEIAAEEKLIDDKSIFNLNAEYSDKIVDSFEINNGENVDYYLEQIQNLGNIVKFNAEQYRVEHSATEDMVIKAGAGTGKTYLLVSRIAFLCWKKKYSERDILTKFVLITFTNDATDEMKERLEQYFDKLFLLTYKPLYFRYVESIENMRISTLDSLGLTIIKRYAYYLGLGRELSITSASLIKRDAIRDALNRVAAIESANDKFNSFQLNKIIVDIVDKFENKNVDIVGKEDLYFSRDMLGSNDLTRYLELIPSIIAEIEEKCEAKNKITTGHIIIYLHRLAKLITKGEILVDADELGVEYVFIDEFQDTDDTQIELVAIFKAVFNFNLFVVGDVKQSIYRFRGADDDKAFATLEEKLGYKVKTYSLKKNYRTNVQLLSYMDKQFRKLSDKQYLTYHDDDELEGVNNPDKPLSVIGIPVITEEEREENIAKAIEAFNSNKGDDDKKKMGILVRRRSEIAKIRSICKKYGIRNVDIDVGGKLYQSDAAIDLYKLAIALQDPGNPSVLYNLYTTSYVNQTLDKAAMLNEKDLVKYFNDHIPLSLEKWEEFLESLKIEPVLKVLKNIVDLAKPWDIYKYSINDLNDKEASLNAIRYKSNLDKLFEKIALEFQGDYLTINSLVEFLSIMIKTEQEEEERDLGEAFPIECRTIHRAKGKEYHTILLPFADVQITSSNLDWRSDYIINDGGFGYSIEVENGLKGSKKEFISNEYYNNWKKIEKSDQSCEEARILYVAVTRAKESVIFLKNNSVKQKNILRWQDFL